MLTNSKIALSVALVLASASAALAAPKHPVRHNTAIQRQAPANAYLSFGAVRSTGSAKQPPYMTIQDFGIRRQCRPDAGGQTTLSYPTLLRLCGLVDRSGDGPND
jgi:hypothetical protein